MKVRTDCDELPLGLSRHVRLGLSWMNAADLAGIEIIHIVEEMKEPSTKAPEWYRLAKAEKFSINGLYLQKWGNTPASIQLFVKDIYRGIPRIFWLTPVLTLRVSRILAHEVGHHLVAVRGYVFQPGERLDGQEYEEELANRYAFGVLKKMRERWYYRLGDWAMKKLADVHYVFGAADWKAQRYEEAAERWYIAWILNPDLEDARYWRHRAKQMYKKPETD